MTYDFIIVGGGIVGMSAAMQLIAQYPRARCLLLEKENEPGRHQSGHNSGVIHAGVYYAPGSRKAEFCREGNVATRRFCDAHGINYQLRGKILVATEKTELPRMEDLWARCMANGLTPERLSGSELRQREPNVTGIGAIFVPSTGIVDFRQVVAAMAGEFRSAGGEMTLGTEVQALAERRGEVVVSTPRGDFITRHLIGCAGLMSDRLVRMLGLEPGFSICPFRGEYYRLAPKHNAIIRHLIYPIPDPSVPFLGVHLTRMIDGSVTVGPNAVLALKREGYRQRDISAADIIEMLADPGVRRMLGSHLRFGLSELRNSLSQRAYLKQVQRYCPRLELADLGEYLSGVRAQAVLTDGRLADDFLFFETARTLHVCNAPSPAATSAIPIGRYIVSKVRGKVGSI